MPSRTLLVLGNIVAVTVTIAAFVQAVTWTIAGLLILVSLVLPLLVNIAPSRPQLTQQTQSKSQITGHGSIIGTKPEFSNEQSTSNHRTIAMIENKLFSKQQTTRPQGLGQGPDEPVNYPMRAKSSGANPPPITLPIKLDPNFNPTIAEDDYVEYEIELEAGKDFLGEVTADGLVNVYLLDEENMDNLDVGEEFWSEIGEEGVETAQLEFTASSKGRWFFVVENADDREIMATVNLQKSSNSAQG